MSTKVMGEGRCLSGAVTVAVEGVPVRMAQCHCIDCRRASGTGHASNAIFDNKDVRIEGTTQSFTVKADSGTDYTRHFCPTCGARIYGTHTGRPRHDHSARRDIGRQRLVLAAGRALHALAASVGHDQRSCSELRRLAASARVERAEKLRRDYRSTRPATASSFAISLGSRASGGVMIATPSAVSEPIGHG